MTTFGLMEPLRRHCSRCARFTAWLPNGRGGHFCPGCRSAELDRSSAIVERDTSLEEYKAYLWRQLAKCRGREDRRVIAQHLERICMYGRAALKSSLEGGA